MSANCYSHHGNVAEMQEQHQRLSSKHIETLKLMADMSKENKKLLTKIKTIETELLHCAHLHAIANDTKASIARIQEDFNRRLNHSNKTLTEKHQHQHMRIVSEKLEAENIWLEEKEQLEKRINQMEEKNARLSEKLDLVKQYDTKVEVLHQQMNKAIAEMKTFKEENARLLKENTVFSNQFIGLEAEVEKLRLLESKSTELSLDLQGAKQKVRELSLRLKDRENVSAASAEYDYNNRTEIVQLKKQVSKLTKAVQDQQDLMLTHQENAVLYKEQLLEKTDSLMEEKHAKENLLTLLNHTQEELHELKKKPRSQKASSGASSQAEVSFKEFVLLKRELNLLKDENMKLKLRRKAALPSVKGSTTSSAPIWSHSGKGDSNSCNISKLGSIPHSLKKY